MTAARSYNSLSLPHRVRPEARGIWHQHTSGSLATIIYEQQQQPPPPDNHSVLVGGVAKSRMNNSHQLSAGKLSDCVSFPSVHTQTPCLKSLSENSHTQTVDARVDRTCQTQQHEHNNNNNNNNNNYSFHSSNITPSSNIVSSSSSMWSDKAVIKQQHGNSQYSLDSRVNSTRPVYDAGGDNSQVLLATHTHTDNNKSSVSHQADGDSPTTVTDGVKSPVDRVFSGDSGVYNCLPFSVCSHHKQYKNGAISINNNNKIESDVIRKDPMTEQTTDSTDKTVCDRKLRERRVQDLISQLNQQRSLYQQARNMKLSTNKNSRSQNGPVKLVARRTEYHNNNNNTYNNRQTRSGNMVKIAAEQYETQDDVVRDSTHKRHDMIALNNNTAANKTTSSGTSTGTTAQYHSHPTVNCDINNNRKKGSSSAVTVNFVRLNRQMAGNNQRHLDVRSRSLPRSQQQQHNSNNNSNSRGDVVKTSHVPAVLPHLQHHATSRAATLPAYLVRRKRKLLAEKLSRQQQNLAKSCQNLVQCPAGYHLMQESQRLHTLQQLTQNQQKLIAELHKLPISCSISGASGQRRLQTLQQHLHQIDAGIQVFSRSRVYVRDDHSQTH